MLIQWLREAGVADVGLLWFWFNFGLSLITLTYQAHKIAWVSLVKSLFAAVCAIGFIFIFGFFESFSLCANYWIGGLIAKGLVLVLLRFELIRPFARSIYFSDGWPRFIGANDLERGRFSAGPWNLTVGRCNFAVRDLHERDFSGEQADIDARANSGLLIGYELVAYAEKFDWDTRITLQCRYSVCDDAFNCADTFINALLSNCVRMRWLLYTGDSQLPPELNQVMYAQVGDIHYFSCRAQPVLGNDNEFFIKAIGMPDGFLFVHEVCSGYKNDKFSEDKLHLINRLESHFALAGQLTQFTWSSLKPYALSSNCLDFYRHYWADGVKNVKRDDYEQLQACDDLSIESTESV